MASCPVANTHRGGIGDTSRPAPDILDDFGGQPGVERFVDVFYDRIADDADLAPVFRGHAHGPHGRGQLVSFLMDWFGGDPSYSRSRFNGGQQRLHYKVAITRRAAALWLKHFDASMAECGVAAETAKGLMRILGPFARQMVNIEGEHRDRVDACANVNYMRRIWTLAAKGDRPGLKARIDDEPTLVRRRGEGGRTLLWEAARHDRLDMARWLLDLGADVDAPGIGRASYGKTSPPETLVMVTPHCAAALRKKREVADILLNAGAVVDIYTASMLGDVAAVEAFIDADPTSASAEDPAEDFYPVAPLHHAVCGKQAKVVDALLARGAEVERHSVRLLTLASRRNALGIAQTLLANGAIARDCRQLLYDVVDVGAGDWADLLIAHGADPKGVGVRGRTMVEFPAVSDMMFAKGAVPTGLRVTCNGNNGNRGLHPEYAQALLDRGADPNGADDDDDRTPLNVAAKSGFDEYVTVLLAHGADPNIADNRGRTPLSRALETKHWDIAARLVRAGAKLPNEPLNKTGETPLHKAAAAGHGDLVQALLDAGGDPSTSTSGGQTPQDYALRAGHDGLANTLRHLQR